MTDKKRQSDDQAQGVGADLKRIRELFGDAPKTVTLKPGEFFPWRNWEAMASKEKP